MDHGIPVGIPELARGFWYFSVDPVILVKLWDCRVDCRISEWILWVPVFVLGFQCGSYDSDVHPEYGSWDSSVDFGI